METMTSMMNGHGTEMTLLVDYEQKRTTKRAQVDRAKDRKAHRRTKRKEKNVIRRIFY